MNRAEAIEAHYATSWKTRGVPCLFRTPPVSDMPQDFCVLKFPPRHERAMWTFATRCMSQPEDECGLELHCFSADDDFGLVELLYATAHFHRTGERLGLGHTVNFGRPWSIGSNLTCGLVSLPYLDGPPLENDDFIQAQFLWLVPVYEQEVALRHTQGLDALEQAFERANVNYLDTQRPSVA